MVNKNSKKVAIFAVLFTVMVGLIPANIAWAGHLWQTLPTRTFTPSATSLVLTTSAPQITASTATNSVTSTPVPQNTVSASASTATRSPSPGFSATITPSPSSSATTNSNHTATVGVVNTKLVVPEPSSAPMQTTAAPVGKITNEIPTNVLTETAQNPSEKVPDVTNEKPSSNDSEDETSIPVSLLLAGGFVLVIIIGSVLRRILSGFRKPE